MAKALGMWTGMQAVTLAVAACRVHGDSLDPAGRAGGDDLTVTLLIDTAGSD